MIRLLFNAIIRLFLGEISWNPPLWLKAIFRIIRDYRKALFSIFLLVLVTLGSLLGYQVWKQSQPQPVQFAVSGSEPKAKPFTEEATPDDLYIYFGGSVAPLNLIGKKVVQEISIEPAMEGTWFWDAENRLKFDPIEDWKPGTEYEVKLDQSLFPEHIHLEKYEYEFRVEKISLSLVRQEFYTSPKDPADKRVVFELQSNYPIDPRKFENLIELNITEKKEGVHVLSDDKISWEVKYDEWKSKATIISEKIIVPLEPQFMQMKLSEGTTSTLGGESYSQEIKSRVRIPSMYDYFKISGSSISYVQNEKFETEQVLIINTTNRVSSDEVLKYLTAYELPKDRPVYNGAKLVKNHYWYESEINSFFLNRSKQINLEVIPSEEEFSKIHTFRFKAKTHRSLYYKIRSGLPSRGGYILAKDFQRVSQIRNYPKEVKILHQGSVLSLSGSKKISILTRDIPHLKIKLNRILPSQIQHLITQTDGDYNSPYFNNYYFSSENISEVFSEIRDIRLQGKEGKSQYSSIDLSQYLKSSIGENRGLFILEVVSWNKKYSYEETSKDKRLVLVTDLGLIVKRNHDHSSHVFVQSIINESPVSRAEVSVLAKNGTFITTLKTDKEGQVKFQNLNSFKNEKAPVAYLVRKGNDFSYIPYNHYSRSLELSQFDTGGEYESGISNKLDLKTYLFSDRGIYRPGEKFHIAGMIKSKDWIQSIAGLPLQIRIFDARGKKVKQEYLNIPENGLFEFDYLTYPESPTGVYRADLYLVKDNKKKFKFLDSTEVRVEEFQPDKLKIRTYFSNTENKAWLRPDEVNALIDLKHLFGAPAHGHRVDANINLVPWQPGFSKFKDYRFFDPDKAKESYQDYLGQTKTDEKGESSFQIDLSRFDEATYRLHVFAEGFETSTGGRSVLSKNSILVSSQDYLIGYKSSQKLNYLYQDSKAEISYLAVNDRLEKIDIDQIKISLIRKDKVSVLTQQSNGLYRYQTVKKNKTLEEKSYKINSTGNSYRLATNKPGEYEVVIRSLNGKILSSVPYFVRGEANLAGDLEKNSELKITLNQKEFNPGEEVEIQIEAPYTGAGLITIERDKVYAYKWFQTDKTHSLHKIKIPRDYEGNGYIQVSFLRNLQSSEIYISPLSYGVVPFWTNLGKRQIHISLDSSEKVKPGDKIKVDYSADKSAKAIIFAVDEGILQVSNYKTPQPLKHFFKKKALQVETLQILDLLLPEIDVRGQKSRFGGDAEGEALSKNLNPFKRKADKPAVYWSGILDIDSEKRSLEFEVPDTFNGKMRIMAVAVNQAALGSTQTKSLVRAPIIINPQVPLFVTPGDIFEVEVGLVPNLEEISLDSKLNLELISQDQFEILSQAKFSFDINSQKEKFFSFKVKAKSKLGPANIKLRVNSNQKTLSKVSRSLSIRPVTHYQTKVLSGYIDDDSFNYDLRKNLYHEFRDQNLMVSQDPLALTQGLNQYLNKFPYQCTEQTVSRIFPAMILSDHPKFRENNIEGQYDHVMNQLSMRQNSDGTFGYWTANSFTNDFVNAYATHFLLESRGKDFRVPNYILDQSLKNLNKSLNHHPQNLKEIRYQTYALYLLTKQGYNLSNHVERLHHLLGKSYENVWEKDLAAIYLAATYQLLKQTSQASALISNIKWDDKIKSGYDSFYNSTIRNSQFLYILAKHFPDRFEKVNQSDIFNLLKPLFDHKYNTINSAYLVLGLSQLSHIDKDFEVDNLVQALDSSSQKVKLNFSEGPWYESSLLSNYHQIQFEPESRGYFYQVNESGFDRQGPTKPLDKDIEIFREFKKVGENKSKTEFKIGENVEVTLKIRAKDNKSFEDIALIHLLPAGFEIDLDSIQRVDSRNYYQFPHYVDVREDRLLLFGVIHDKVKEYKFKIKATHKGEFQLPAVYVESMYHPEIKAHTVQSQIKIIE